MCHVKMLVRYSININVYSLIIFIRDEAKTYCILGTHLYRIQYLLESQQNTQLRLSYSSRLNRMDENRENL